MALTRKYLKAMSIEEEKIEQIIEAHSETVTGLKEEAEKFKEDASKVAALQDKLTKAEELAKSAEKDPFKIKYEALKEEFEGFKSDITNKETKASKSKAYKALLKELNISDKVLDKVLKLADIDSLEIEDGKIKDVESLTENLKTEWGDFIVADTTKKATVDTPPKTTTDTKDPFLEGFGL